jgi:lysophospholipase L1-like esterase
MSTSPQDLCPTPPPSTRRPRVLVLGDSITQQSDPTLHDGLDVAYDLTVWGIGGSRADEHVHDDELFRAVDPDQVIIDLGTNDVLQGIPPDQTIAALTRIGSACATARAIHFVTVTEGVFGEGSPELWARSVDLNARIEAMAAAHGWRVIPWHEIVDAYLEAGEPEGPITSDTIHPTDVGRRLLAAACARALREP